MVADELSRPDSLSASVTARSAGERVENLSQRTESSRVFANPGFDVDVGCVHGPGHNVP